MAKSMYQVNPNLYDAHGRKRPGAVCDTIKTYVRTDDVSKTDRKNREIVTKKMVQYVGNGAKPEQAALVIANNPRVKKAFEYLTKAGIDLKELFVNFYLSEINRKNEENDIMRK